MKLSVPNFIRRDFWRKFMALFLALLLYFAITWRLRSDERVTDVPVSLKLPSELVSRDEEPLKVSLVVSGNRARLSEILPSAVHIRAEVDSAGVVPGEPCKLRLRSSDVTGLPLGVRVTEIIPRDVPVHLEAVVTKRVPVKPRFDSESNLPLDYAVSGTRFSPAEVMLSGPESLLEPVTAVYTEPIPLDEQVVESFEYQAALRIPRNLRSDRERVEAQVDIVKAVTLRTFAAVPLRIVQSPDGEHRLAAKSLSPRSVTVEVSGPKGTLAEMHSNELKAYLDIDSLDKPGTFQLPVKVLLDSARRDVTVKNFHPAAAEVVVYAK